MLALGGVTALGLGSVVTFGRRKTEMLTADRSTERDDRGNETVGRGDERTEAVDDGSSAPNRTPETAITVDAGQAEAVGAIGTDPHEVGPKPTGFGGTNFEDPGIGRSGEITAGNLATIEARPHDAFLEFTVGFTTLPALEDEFTRLSLTVNVYEETPSKNGFAAIDGAGGTLTLWSGTTAIGNVANIDDRLSFSIAVEGGSYTLRGGSDGGTAADPIPIGLLVGVDFYAPPAD